MPKAPAAARNRAEPRWASLKDASKYAGGIPIRTLRDWIAKGLLPACRIGPRQIQIDLNDIDALRTRIPGAGNGKGAGVLLPLSREEIRAVARELAALGAEQPGEPGESDGEESAEAGGGKAGR